MARYLRRFHGHAFVSDCITKFTSCIFANHQTESLFYLPRKLLTTPCTPHPLQYELILYTPEQRESVAHAPQNGSVLNDVAVEACDPGMDKSKRKYYRKRRKRMYGLDSDNDGKDDKGYVSLQPEVLEFNSLHEREEELFFYDTFAFPWAKNKHYKMVYELEKKYFPEHCFDKAFLDPKDCRAGQVVKEKAEKEVGRGDEERGLVFFEEKYKGDTGVDMEKGMAEKKVAEFFKSLRNDDDKDKHGVHGSEPFLVSRGTELPASWDGPCGTVVLIDKPKGWTSFTVCGKLRRIVKVNKVGHAGILDPLATGLLLVCVGNVSKFIERYYEMVNTYNGVFRLGEATSTWDAESPVILREPWEHIQNIDIKQAAANFCGEQYQVPPIFSTMKVGGEKMYDRARREENLSLSPRKASIFQFDVQRSLEDRQNLMFRITCSSGTNIRSLCADFGKALGSCAHLRVLRRDSIGEYFANDAWDIRDLEEAMAKNYF